MSLIDRVRRTIRRHKLVPPGARLIAAVSGGPDSVALAHVLRALEKRGDLRLTAIAHVNHQLRLEANSDEEHCRLLAHELSVPFIVEQLDVRARAASRKVSVEAAAHDARYAFFERVRAEQDADLVALGHTKDDQAETLLLRLTRGAGAKGLGGMHPRSGSVVRPLVDCRRAELRAFLDTNHVSYVHDLSNDDVSIPRNRVRAELLPLLESRFNPRIVDALSRASELARAEQEYMDAEASAYWSAHATRCGDGWSLDARELALRPLAVQRRVMLHGMSVVAPKRSAGFEHVERALGLLQEGSTFAELPGVALERHGRLIVLRGRPRAAAKPDPPPFRYTLCIPGEVRIDELGCVVSAEVRGDGASNAPELLAGQGVLFPMALTRGGPLAVRNRRPGDRVRPGRGGSRKLQDVLVDRKVPRAERDRIPLVVDADDRIIWVPGHVFSQEFRVTDPAQAVVVLRLKGVGGSC